MTSMTTRLESLATDGTGGTFDRIRLADGHMLTIKVRPGADMADEVFLMSGLTAPDTGAWEIEDDLEHWLTGGEFSDGTLHLNVPIEAVRDLIVEHGGEHDDQEGADAEPEGAETGDRDVPLESARTIVTRALAERGITAYEDGESMIEGGRNSWLIVGYDQTRKGFPISADEPYIVLYLYAETTEDEEVTVARAPRTGDRWHLLAADATGNERPLMTPMAFRLAEVIEAIAEWVTGPRPTRH
ncbi:hypothetical protein [Kitasatospora aureofaciens]|uniref:hypothetical protein n=1 Tax=Kitasatospora aureofaciens TaxID=1894 RepID=UPI00052715A6|nr:hypothetical protein [Kitasatospora aureofaciens]